MKIEEETIAFVATIILEHFPKLDKKTSRAIAFKALKEDKVADPKWLETAVKQFSYDRKFKQVRKFEKKMLEEVYGRGCFKFLESVLKEPSRISPRWASHFLAAADEIGRDEVQKVEDPYQFVKTSPAWKQCKKARKYLSAEARRSFVV